MSERTVTEMPIEGWLSLAHKHYRDREARKAELATLDSDRAAEALTRGVEQVRQTIDKLIPSGFPRELVFVDSASVASYLAAGPFHLPDQWAFGGVRLPNGGEIRIYVKQYAEGQWTVMEYTEQLGGTPFKVRVPNPILVLSEFVLDFEERSHHDFLIALAKAEEAGEQLAVAQAEVDRLNAR